MYQPLKRIGLGECFMEDWMTVSEVADYLKLGKTKIYQYVQQGKIPGYKIGGQWRFNRTEIDQWIRSGSSSRIHSEPHQVSMPG